MGLEEHEHDDFAGLVKHYDDLMEELRKTHNTENEMANLKIQKLEATLKEKQTELYGILEQFAPLVKIHSKEKTVEDDRHERIEKHWKADIALLEVLLEKHKIRAFLPVRST